MERYQPLKFDRKSSLEKPKGRELTEANIDNLKEIRSDLEKIRSFRRKRAIEQGKERAKLALQAGESNEEKSDVQQQREFLKSILSEKMNYSNHEIHLMTFGEQKTYSYNQEKFNGENGWSAEYDQYYLDNVNSADLKSLEEFVLEKRFAELENTREMLLAERSEKFVSEFEFDDIKRNSADSEEFIKKTSEFFKENQAKLTEFYENNDTEAYDDFKLKFEKTIFSENELSNPKNRLLVDEFFANLMVDYHQMIIEKHTLERLNSEMIEAMLDNVSENEWIERLNTEAKKQINQIKEEEQIKNILAQPSYFGDVLSGPVAVDIGYDLIPANSRIRFEKLADGKYKIVYPGEIYQTFFEVKEIEDSKTKKKELAFVFEDKYLDQGYTLTDKNGFAKQVNALHLDQVMNRDFKRGRDYQGLDMNSVFNDQSMIEVVSLLLYPKSLNRMPLNDQDILIFKNLLKIVSNSTNLAKTKNLYGDLRILKTRIAILKHVLIKPANALKMREYLNGQNANFNSNINSISLESFLNNYLNIPVNYGNYQKD